VHICSYLLDDLPLQGSETWNLLFYEFEIQFIERKEHACEHQSDEGKRLCIEEMHFVALKRLSIASIQSRKFSVDPEFEGQTKGLYLVLDDAVHVTK